MRGNPFGTLEADQEREFLAEFFVDVDGYEAIRASRTVIVFAPRGSGKSALRVVLASQFAPIDPGANILAVEYTDFNGLLEKYFTEKKLSIATYVQALVRVGLRSLTDVYLLPYPDSRRNRKQIERIEQITAPSRVQLAHLLWFYAADLYTVEVCYRSFAVLHPDRLPSWQDFLQAANKRCMRSLMDAWNDWDPRLKLLADLNDSSPLPGNYAPQRSPREILQQFVQLAQDLGFTVHFLFDRLDEMQQTADDPNLQADLLEPLLADLPVVELPGVFFKFFISQPVKEVLFQRKTIRQDRLIALAITVSWPKQRLLRLLNERLRFFSQGNISQIVQICVDSSGAVSGPASVDWLEQALIQISQGSPRRLIRAGQLLLDTHFQLNSGRKLIDMNDWQRAREELLRLMPPILRLIARQETVLIGDSEKKLSPIEFRMLQVLIEHGGECEREKFIGLVWRSSEGVTNAAVDQAIMRLRRKLGDDSQNPIYLQTTRGSGFKLQNYETVS